jgi:uncharacterized protein (TIGR02058 family)
MKRLLIEIGTGIDQHNQDVTHAAQKAVRDAITRNYLTGLRELAGVTSPDQMIVKVLIAAPRPEEVDKEKVLSSLPFGRKSIEVVQGGMLIDGGLPLKELNENSGEIVLVNAAITVGIEG